MSDYFLQHSDYHEIEISDYPDKNVKIKLVEPKIRYATESLLWLSDPEVGQYMGADFSNLSLKGEEKRLQEIIDDKNQYNWCISFNGKIIGNVNINSIDKKSMENRCRSGDMAILIGDKSYWGKKIAYFALKAVINWAFSEGNFQELHARIMEENLKSIRTFENLGFQLIDVEHEDMNNKTVLWKRYKISKQNGATCRI